MSEADAESVYPGPFWGRVFGCVPTQGWRGSGSFSNSILHKLLTLDNFEHQLLSLLEQTSFPAFRLSGV